MTSAPRSASIIVQYGPASTREKSATSRPASGPGREGGVVEPSAACSIAWSGYQSGDAPHRRRLELAHIQHLDHGRSCLVGAPQVHGGREAPVVIASRVVEYLPDPPLV